MTDPNFSHDVIIAGGGMVGLALAIAAAENGLRVAVLEKNRFNDQPLTEGSFSPRVSAINHASERLLRNLGAWALMPQSRLSPYTDMHVWDSLGSGDISFSAHDVQTRHLGHIIENRLIVEGLHKAAQGHTSIDLFTEETVTDYQESAESVTVHTSLDQTLTARVLVGSEGKHSPIRQKSGLESWQWDYGHTAIVTTVKHERPHNRCASQVFLESGPLAFLPLQEANDGQHFSSIVWSVQRDMADGLMELDDEAFSHSLEQAFEARYGSILSVDPRYAFELTAQQAKQYFQGRVVILGDAAHTIHPLAGLGVNLGFLDAATLADCWAKSHTRQQDIGDEFTMRRYQRQRQSHNLAVAGLMEALKRGFGTQAPAPLLLRNTGLKLFNRNPILKRPLIKAALGDAGLPLPSMMTD